MGLDFEMNTLEVIPGKVGLFASLPIRNTWYHDVNEKRSSQAPESVLLLLDMKSVFFGGSVQPERNLENEAGTCAQRSGFAH